MENIVDEVDKSEKIEKYHCNWEGCNRYYSTLGKIHIFQVISLSCKYTVKTDLEDKNI